MNLVRLTKCTVVALLLSVLAALWYPFQSQSQSTGKTFAPAMEWRPTHAPANTKYLGNKACAECHTQTDTQHKTPMGKALELATDCGILKANPKLTFKSGNYAYTITRQGNQSIYSVTDGKETMAAPILYAFGQGKAGQTYVLAVSGKYYESRVSFYNEIAGLDYTLGAPREPAKSLTEAFGRSMDSLDTKDCFSCHATAAVSERQLQLDKLTPGITCEGCHGGGEQHVALMKSKGDGAKRRRGEMAILNPGHFDTEGLTQFCGSCHRTWAQVQLMKEARGVVNVRFQPYRIFGSKCYDFDDKRISCTTCHDPHEETKQNAAFYDAKCMACHGKAEVNNDVKMYPSCKAGKTNNCASCHMPQYEIPGAHHKFSDHWIRVVKPGETYPN
ncbi:MAG TPA: multiheme c-type cytochrome [Blastocatellia bacterium]|nr:multiheme c-type cytochrome [Blastocatellia bacterium]